MSSTTALMTISVEVNGRQESIDTPPMRPLADTLRVGLGLTGTKLGCRGGDCGSCTVLLDDVPVTSCLTPSARADRCRVVTVEGLARTPSSDANAAGSPVLHPLQDAFRRHNASQCGYCIPGIVMASAELATRSGPLDRSTVRRELAGNLCRCTGYESIIDAILDAHGAAT